MHRWAEVLAWLGAGLLLLVGSGFIPIGGVAFLFGLAGAFSLARASYIFLSARTVAEEKRARRNAAFHTVALFVFACVAAWASSEKLPGRAGDIARMAAFLSAVGCIGAGFAWLLPRTSPSEQPASGMQAVPGLMPKEKPTNPVSVAWALGLLWLAVFILNPFAWVAWVFDMGIAPYAGWSLLAWFAFLLWAITRQKGRLTGEARPADPWVYDSELDDPGAEDLPPRRR